MLKVVLQRRLEREIALYGGAPPATDSTADGSDEYDEEDEDSEPVPSVSGIVQINTLYRI